MMTTVEKLPVKQWIKTHLYINLRSKAGLLRDLTLDAAKLRSIGDMPMEVGRYGIVYRERNQSRHSERIPKENLEIIRTRRITSDDALEDIKSRSREVISDVEIQDPSKLATPSRAMVTQLVHRFLQSHPEIRSVANIGAFVDNQSAYLSQKHPNVKFISVDTMEDIDAINQFFPKLPNWTFRSGYALDLLESGTLSADLMFMTSTSVCFTYKELDAYIRALSKQTKYVVFNEPWWPSLQSMRFYKVSRPEEIDPERPQLGLFFLNYQHNYIHYLKKYGFEIISSKIRKTGGSSVVKDWYTLQIVAKKS